MALLTAEAFHLRDCHARNPQRRQSLAYGIELEWLDDGSDALHLIPPLVALPLENNEPSILKSVDR